MGSKGKLVSGLHPNGGQNKHMALNGAIGMALGAIILVIAAVIVLVVLPIANDAIDDYADGPDDVLGGASTDDPPASQVSLLNLFPLVVIAALVIGGVAFLIDGFREIRTT